MQNATLPKPEISFEETNSIEARFWIFCQNRCCGYVDGFMPVLAQPEREAEVPAGRVLDDA